MEIIGTVVIAIVMLCAVAGAVASCFRDDEGLGKEFLAGLHSIGYIFIPVAGIMASLPYLQQIVRVVFGAAYSSIGADPAMAATSFIAVDMGGYQLAQRLAATRESWIMAMMAGYMAGATIVFSIPVGLAMLQKRDHKYMALGVMSGLLSIPLGVGIASALLVLLQPDVRVDAATQATAATATLGLTWGTLLLNLLPLAILVSALALGLRLFPDAMIRGFMAFGRGLDIILKLVLAFSIVQYFTHIFGDYWGFDPIIGVEDTAAPLRALEIAGYIGIMLAGAFPMVYLLQKYLAGPIGRLGNRLGLAPEGAAGLLAAAANILAMFRLVKDMRPKDKVLVIAFSVCSAFLFGDHLSFTANFQPNLILAVMLGKLGGGACGFLIAYRLSVPKALELAEKEVSESVPCDEMRDPEMATVPI
ncbi:MAG: ethanolamine utilization protein EutH [Gemmataceae bacterium]